MKMRFVTLSFLACLLLAFTFLQVSAHGGGELQLNNAPAGPYYVSVWLNPPTIQAGKDVHVTVGISSSTGEDARPELEAQVLVQLMPLGASEPVVTSSATTEQSTNKLFYETDFKIEKAGIYVAQIAVAGPAGQGNTAFAVEVLPPPGVNWVVVGLAAVAAVLVITLLLRRRRAVRSQIKPV